MTRALPLPPGVFKEIRALLPTWIASMAAVGLAAAGGTPGFHDAGVLAYCFGTVALGALSIGHAYAHGTLAQLLSTRQSRTAVVGEARRADGDASHARRGHVDHPAEPKGASSGFILFCRSPRCSSPRG
jgi:hypothetical protein